MLTRNDGFPYTPARLKQVLIPSPMRNPWTMIGSDALPGFGINRVHPRTMGTFPRVPGKCVRKDGVRREIGGVMCSIS